MSFNARRLARPLILSTVTLLGCGDVAQPEDITDQSPLSARSANECGEPAANHHGKKFEKRCRHYKHSDRPRSDQSGMAKMTTRALIDVNNVTLVEATTGTFDDGSVPPGWFDQLKIRVAKLKKNGNADGDDMDVVDPKAHTGYLAVAFPSAGGAKDGARRTLLHGQGLRVTGVVKGVDPRATVITIDDQVKYRPDLMVSRIDVPSAMMRMPVTITASVNERMGDVGALADCVLTVDGAGADVAKNVWVDKGGTVACQFTHTFNTAGAHAIHVDVANVRPGDYDMRNNGADATVTVAQPFTFAFSGSALDSTYTSSYREQVLDASSNVLYEQNSSSTGHNHSVTVSGTWDLAVTFPLATASVNATSAGAAWTMFSATGFAGVAQGDGSTCAAGPDDTGSDWVTVCATAGESPMTQIMISESAGDVTYHSDMTCAQTSAFYDCTDGYTWNVDGSDGSGVGHALSGSLAMQVKVTDAAGASLSGNPVISVQPYSTVQDQPVSCIVADDGSRDCVEQHFSESGMKGSVGQ